MDRKKMLAQLKDNGFDVSVITDEVPDDVLAEMLAAYEPDDDTENHDEDDEDSDENLAKMSDEDIADISDKNQKATAFFAKSKRYRKIAEAAAKGEDIDLDDEPTAGSKGGAATTMREAKKVRRHCERF